MRMISRPFRARPGYYTFSRPAHHLLYSRRPVDLMLARDTLIFVYAVIPSSNRRLPQFSCVRARRLLSSSYCDCSSLTDDPTTRLLTVELTRSMCMSRTLYAPICLTVAAAWASSRHQRRGVVCSRSSSLALPC